MQIWVPDTGLPGFATECKRQSQLANQSDVADTDLLKLMEGAVSHHDSAGQDEWSQPPVASDG